MYLSGTHVLGGIEEENKYELVKNLNLSFNCKIKIYYIDNKDYDMKCINWLEILRGFELE